MILWLWTTAALAGDKDGDGVPNKTDTCRDEPEDIDGFQDEDGCPDPDNDEDGIEDVDDNLPRIAGAFVYPGQVLRIPALD